MLQKPLFFVGLAFFCYLLIGSLTLTNFVTADEHFWLPNYGTERVQDYWRAVRKGDWKDTRINDKPGVTLAHVSGIALPFTENLIQHQVISDDGVVKVFDPAKTKLINFFFRFPLLLVNGLIVFYLFFLLRRITGDAWLATLAAVLLYLSPVLLGISQIVNPDTLFWSFGSATLLTFFAYLRFREQKLVWYTTLFFGLALASKYVSVIFIPFFMVMLGLDYWFRNDEYIHSSQSLTARLLTDLKAYWTVLLGGSILFAILMPAALVKPKIFFESTIGFGGMWPIFLTIVAFQGILILDALLLESKMLRSVVGWIAPYRGIIEKTLYGIIFLTLTFVLFNWTLRNGLYDLSGIPFDAKTKDSFTEENAFIARYLVEHVALVFSLTPLVLFSLLFFCIRAFWKPLQDRLFPITLAMFILVFYLAVIQEGLLVTTRYSIILFPIATILAAMGIRAFFEKSDTEPSLRRPTLFFSLTMMLYGAVFVSMFWYFRLDKTSLSQIKIFLQDETKLSLLIIVIGIILILSVSYFAFCFIYPRFRKYTVSPVILTSACLLLSLIPLYRTSPHFFIYANELLPKEYLIMHSWGYGGYEIANHLNQKPNAKDLTLWTDTHGVCEFFVGKCIHKAKLDLTKYSVDYIFQSYGGSINAKFPYEKTGLEWQYVIDGREKNFMKIYRNDPVVSREKYLKQQAAKSQSTK